MQRPQSCIRADAPVCGGLIRDRHKTQMVGRVFLILIDLPIADGTIGIVKQFDFRGRRGAMLGHGPKIGRVWALSPFWR